MLVGGTSSDAGKSLVVAGLCRALNRLGVRVAPFKAQNMSNNSVVTPDGGEIGRAQALQAFACGLEPSTRFNPVLLKPGGDRRSHVVLRGQPAGEVGAADYVRWRGRLADVVADEFESLRRDFDVVIAEGAGSVAEINLRRTDIANFGLAQRHRLPVLLVTDIDRGGSLAHLFGTTAILDPADQALITAFVVNKFRGDPLILEPGLERLRELTGRSTLGVLPYANDLWLDAEDSLNAPVGRRVGPLDEIASGGPERLSVAAIRLPRISNSTDVEALACERGVDVTWVDDPGSVYAADLVVLPGTRATVSDLGWLTARGIGDALVARVRRGAPIVAICGGFQMLARSIDDPVESGAGRVDGLGILDLDVTFDSGKTLRRVAGAVDGHRVEGYEIHHGRIVGSTEDVWLVDDVHGGEGATRGAVRGTHWHGLLANNDFRRDLLRRVAAEAGKPGFEPAPDIDVGAIRQAQVDLMADLITANIDMSAVVDIIADGPPVMPTITHRLEPSE
ncbi:MULTISPECIES: cobyric acid synthase [unclassified Gordonia (in: high G+C Gram-positive bacteria)]|uniref:cobyric acid synthase n=1 Tax=unclassified Gordonia (in: high G+C Gram-positive bacteria) TaxID=2657482 RepID=UPI001F0F5AC9|nr:cobyric acid synthase [Gordonia sp. ABSL49_1]MCH5642399.1 cobyric acid synthase [Gordonia sp. ABSL49_1]